MGFFDDPPAKEHSWEGFASETSFHGAAELIRARGRRPKCIWIIIILMGISLMLFLLGETTKEFIMQPASSEIHDWSPPQFPEILFCPNKWVDKEKLAHYGLRPEHKHFVESLLSYYYKMPEPAISPEEARVLREEFKAAMERNGTDLEGMLANVANDIGFHILEAYDQRYFERVNATYKMVILPQGICYQVKPMHQLSELEAHYNVFKLTIRGLWERDSSAAGTTFEKVFVGANAVSVNPVGASLFETGRNYRVQIEAIAVEKRNTFMVPCKHGWDTRRQSICTYKCLLNWVCPTGCRILHSKEWAETGKATTIDTICSHLDEGLGEEEHCVDKLFREEKGDACYSKDVCEDPCERTTFTASSYALPDDHRTDITYLTFSFLHGLQSTMIKEFAAYSWESYVSNIGGTISLFFGASILSLIHAISYYVEYRLEKRKKRKAEEAEAKAAEEQDGFKKVERY